MWFSGLRGAISYALSLHLDFSDETRHVIITTTLIIVLFTTLIFGGSTMPLLKFLRAEKKQKSNSRRKKKDKEVSLSKTREWVIKKNCTNNLYIKLFISYKPMIYNIVFFFLGTNYRF